MDLVEFLNARLNEDEQIARAAGRATGGDAPDAVAYVNFSTHDQEAVADHITRHDPTRVLAEVDAKRRILAGITEADPHGAHITGMFTAWDVLRLLALPYAGHPGYDEAWHPAKEEQ